MTTAKLEAIAIDYSMQLAFWLIWGAGLRQKRVRRRKQLEQHFFGGDRFYCKHLKDCNGMLKINIPTPHTYETADLEKMGGPQASASCLTWALSLPHMATEVSASEPQGFHLKRV